MEYPSAKRRKTSPLTEADIDASKGKPQVQNSHGTSRSQPPASFLSPTKASLSRYHPNVLRRLGSAEPSRSAAGSIRASHQAQTGSRLPSSPKERLNGVRGGHEAQDHADINGHVSGSDNPSSTIDQETPSKLPARLAATRGGLHQENLLQPQTPVNERKRQAFTGDDAGLEEQQPSLPSTPSQLGLEPPAEKPRGLLFQSPGRRRGHQSRIQAKGSPLKGSGLPEPRLLISQHRITSVLGNRDLLKGFQRTQGSTRTDSHNSSQGSLERLARRIMHLQRELSILSIQPQSLESKRGSSKKQARLKKQVAQDSRALAGQNPLSGFQSEFDAQSYAPHSAASTGSLAGLQSKFFRSAYLSPFVYKSSHSSTMRASNIDDAMTVSSSLDQDVKLIKSKVIAPADNQPFVQQELAIYLQDRELLSHLSFHLDPVNQTLSSISTPRMVPWATAELAPWLLDETSPRSLHQVGGMIRQYIELAKMRSSCWTQCLTKLPDLASPHSIDQVHLGVAKAPLKANFRWRLITGRDDEVESSLSVEAEIPSLWRRLDASRDWERIDEAFEGLILKRGVTGAIMAMVELLFSTES